MENLHKVDHLPIGRRGLLAWLVIPVSLFFLLGYGTGRLVEQVAGARPEAILFDHTEENYGLLVPPETWARSATDRVPDIVSPSGEVQPAKTVPLFAGSPWVLWKPYTTPAGASVDFVAWQISRAAAEVYELEIRPEDIADRYLEAGPEGRVQVRPGGLTLMADYPAARLTTDAGPVLPVWVGAEIIVLLLVNTVFFRACGPGTSIRKSRIIFWIMMVGLLAIHVGGFLLLVQGWTRDWVIYGFWMGLIRDLGKLGPAGWAAAWLGAILGIAAAWRLAVRALENVEAPAA
jgi:hypothetical protein